MSRATVRRRLAGEGGITLVELLGTMVILAIVLGSLTQLFVSATRAQVDLSDRFQAQQNARLALDSLRREIHCASAVAPTPGLTSQTGVDITLGAQCPSGALTVTWCTSSVGTQRYVLRRIAPALSGGSCAGGVLKADYLKSNLAFPAISSATGCLRSKLSVDFPVDIKPATVGGVYRLTDDVVLRNTGSHAGC